MIGKAIEKHEKNMVKQIIIKVIEKIGAKLNEKVVNKLFIYKKKTWTCLASQSIEDFREFSVCRSGLQN